VPSLLPNENGGGQRDSFYVLHFCFTRTCLAVQYTKKGLSLK